VPFFFIKDFLKGLDMPKFNHPNMLQPTSQHQLMHYHYVNSPYGRTFYTCDTKWQCCKTYIPPYPTCPKLSNIVDPTHSTYVTLKI
jgi:hypothetical protein